MKLDEFLHGQPVFRTIPEARNIIRNKLVDSGKRLVVIDDDPTGIQTVHGVNVYFKWTVNALCKALNSGEPVFFISTNSRGLSREDAWKVTLEVSRNLKQASKITGAEILLASRSDSTLRGHFPIEVDALTTGLELEPDGIIIAPAFFEAGRYTINDIQLAEQQGELIPVNQTEFAADPVFGFKSGNLRDWIAEKMGGAIRPEDVQSISLRMIREGGPETVCRELLRASKRRPIIANAACYEDLEILAMGILEAEAKGKIFAYRCAASFIKARGGFEDKPLLSHKELRTTGGPGLIIAGSYVNKTSRQIKLLMDSGLTQGIELRVRELLDEKSRIQEVRLVSEEVNRNLAAGETTVIFTSREVQSVPKAEFLNLGSKITDSLCDIVRLLQVRPDYIVAKGGITSIELARSALNVDTAFAIGQIINGVPVLRPGPESTWPDIPYVIFPGNVGDDEALLNAVKVLNGD